MTRIALTAWNRFGKHAALAFCLALLLVPILFQSTKEQVGRVIGFHNISNSVSGDPMIRPTHSINTTHHNNKGSRRPRLIVHVGPSKSATTSLQTDMTAFQRALHQDGILYAGRYYHPFINQTSGLFHINRTETVLSDLAHHMLVGCHLEPKTACLDDFLEELNSFAASETGPFDVILSDESLGNQWDTPDDWLAIREALSEEWDVTIVIGYRRFFSWIVSSHFQRERLDRSHGGLNELWVSQGGRAKQALYPKWVHNTEHYQHTYQILDSLQDIFPVQIINLHNLEGLSPPTLLFCTLLNGITQNTCQKSHRHDHNPTMINLHTKIPSLYYDAIATAGETAGLIDASAWTRAVVRDAVWRFHEEERGLEPQDLPLDCPGDVEMKDLLEFSLGIESKYMSDFFESNETIEADHIAGFQSYVDQGIFCFVNTTAVLALPEWMSFFQQFST